MKEKTDMKEKAGTGRKKQVQAAAGLGAILLGAAVLAGSPLKEAQGSVWIRQGSSGEVTRTVEEQPSQSQTDTTASDSKYTYAGDGVTAEEEASAGYAYAGDDVTAEEEASAGYAYAGDDVTTEEEASAGYAYVGDDVTAEERASDSGYAYAENSGTTEEGYGGFSECCELLGLEAGPDDTWRYKGKTVQMLYIEDNSLTQWGNAGEDSICLYVTREIQENDISFHVEEVSFEKLKELYNSGLGHHKIS